VKSKAFILICGLGLGLAAAAMLTSVYRGAWMQVLAASCLMLYVGMPATTAGFLALVIGTFAYKRVMLSASAVAFAVAFFCLAVFASVPVGEKLLARDVAAAQTWCEDAGARLKACREAQGGYPQAFDALKVTLPAPVRFIRPEGASFYAADANACTLTFEAPDGPLPTVYVFDVAAGTWEKHS
jgi:hypothetical protein